MAHICTPLKLHDTFLTEILSLHFYFCKYSMSTSLISFESILIYTLRFFKKKKMRIKDLTTFYTYYRPEKYKHVRKQ